MADYGGAGKLRVGERVRIDNNHYRHYLRGLEGRITGILHIKVIVELDNDPNLQQRIISPAGGVGPKKRQPHQRLFYFNEVSRIPNA